MKQRHDLLLGLLLVWGAPALVKAGGETTHATTERHVQLMGTSLRAVVEAPTRAEALAASERALAAVAEAEARLSTWNPASELSRFNAAPAGTSVRLSRLLARDLEAARRCGETTAGAFNLGLGQLIRAWGLRTGGRQPTDAEIEALLPALDIDQLHTSRSRATRLDGRFEIEEGGFGKGVGLDDAIGSLRSTRATGALFDFGGQVMVWGKRTAVVALADPRDRERVVLQVHISRGSLATSGNSERGIVVEGRRHGHILDPRTGRPVPDFGSMTVWSESAAEADCLATGFYVLGPREAVSRASRSHDFELIVLEVTAEGLVAHASSSFAGRLEPSVDDVTLHWIER